jgi:O-antigen ligase
MSSRAATRRLVVWAAFVTFCMLAMIDPQLPYQKLPVVGVITYYEALLVLAGIFGVAPLLRAAGSTEKSGRRTLSRILIAYMAFELLLVVPVSYWLGDVKLTVVLSTVGVRFTWLLFPVMLVVCSDDRTRSRAATIVVVAAAALVLWGTYLAATGGAGYYVEAGEVRFRVLYGGATLMFAWPFVLAASDAVPRRFTAVLIGMSLVGLTLTNHRSGMIAFAIAGLVCVVMSGQAKRILPWIVPLALIGTVGVLLWERQISGMLGFTASRLFDVTSGNGADRLMRWRLAWEFFVSRPFNDYVWSWRYYLVYVRDLYSPHNFVLEIAVTEGIAGLVFYGSILTTAFREAWKWGRRDAQARALIGYLIAYLVFVFANASWYLPVNIALLVGAVAALVIRIDRLRAGKAGMMEAGVAPSQEPLGGLQDPVPDLGALDGGGVR